MSGQPWQCQNKVGILKEKPGRENSTPDGLVWGHLPKDLLATSGWEQWEGKSSSHFCMMPNKLCAVEACFPQQHREFKLWQFYMTGVPVNRTNKSSSSHGFCELSCSHALWGFIAAMRTPIWQCLCIHQTFLFISAGFVDQRLKGNVQVLSFFLQLHFKC